MPKFMRWPFLFLHCVKTNKLITLWFRPSLILAEANAKFQLRILQNDHHRPEFPAVKIL